MNHVVLLGHLTREPVFRTTSKGTERAWFTVACNEVFKRRDGSAGESVYYPPVVVWEPLTDYVRQHCHKGTKVFIEGYVRTSSFKRDNTRIYTCEIYARMIVAHNRASSGLYNQAPNGQGFTDMGQSTDEEIPF